MSPAPSLLSSSVASHTCTSGNSIQQKEIPILFSTAMVQAILSGQKTMTRRIMKPQPTGSDIELIKDWNGEIFPRQKYGKPGDILWVRENWFPAAINGNKVLLGYDVNNGNDTYEFSTDNVDYYWKQLNKGRVLPSIHMPKEACRIWLQITEIRVERVQKITPKDAELEGIEHLGGDIWKDYMNKKCFPEFMRGSTFTRTSSFKSLWEKINGQQSWEENPYVWVITFKVLSTTGKPNA